jgi:predicted ATPase
MITELLASNYRSLGPEVKLRPGRLTVLVGPNGSGKSNLLDVLTFIRDATLQGLPAAITHRGGIGSVRRRSHGHPYNVKVDLRLLLDGQLAGFGFELTGDKVEEYRVKSEWASACLDGQTFAYARDGETWNGPAGLAPRIDEQSLAINSLGGDERFKPLVDYLSALTVYSIFPDTLRRPQKFDPARPMQRHGENWVSILREMIKLPTKHELIAGLEKLTGDIDDVRVSSAAGYLIAEFRQRSTGNSKSKKWFEAGLQSDGTLRVAGLLTALLQEPSVPMLGIEAPELTVHPGALPMLYDFLAQASERSQVMVTTHSPLILDVLDIDECSLFVVEREDGVSSVQRVSSEQLQPVRQRLLSLGDLYLSGDLQISFGFA